MNLQKLNFGKITLTAVVFGWFVVLVTIFQNCSFIKPESLTNQPAEESVKSSTGSVGQ